MAGIRSDGMFLGLVLFLFSHSVPRVFVFLLSAVVIFVAVLARGRVSSVAPRSRNSLARWTEWIGSRCGGECWFTVLAMRTVADLEGSACPVAF
jgi:hypothetical protein